MTLWNFTTDANVDSSPAYDNGSFFFGTTGGSFYRINQDGQEVWKTNTEGRIETTPAIAFGSVFFGASDGTLHALDAQTGNELWQFPTGSGVLSPPAIASNGILYQATTSGSIYALNVTNGAELWSYQLEASVVASPVLDNGCLFLIDTNGVIHAITDCYSVTFSETGLPTGTTWDMSIGQENSSSNTNTNTFSLTNGVYTYNVSRLNGYTPNPTSDTVAINGKNLTISISFSPSWQLPSAPTNATATGAPESILLKWEPPENDGAPSNFVGNGINTYNIYRGTTSGNEKYYDRTNGTILIYTDNSVNAGTVYFYEMTAINREGESGFSNEVSAQEAVVTAPSPPVDLTAAPQNNGIYLEFNQPASNGGTTISQYAIYRGIEHGSESIIETIPANQTDYVDKPVAPGTTYYYFVEAINSAGTSNPSNTVIVVANSEASSPWNLDTELRAITIIVTVISGILVPIIVWLVRHFHPKNKSRNPEGKSNLT
jgi:outer membrane protein assembly factor BamB